MLRIGHRGASGDEPENTLRSFDRALQLGVDMIELDVHVCKSGELVVIHDEKVDRTTNGKGCVADKTLDELRVLDAGKGERIPTLPEALDLIHRRAQVNIELKGARTAKPVSELLEEYVGKFGWLYDDFLISSFSQYELQEFRESSRKARIGVLVANIATSFVEFAEEIAAYSINLYAGSVSQELVDDIHMRGMKVLVWTVDDVSDIGRMRRMGVDGIFSNYPERI